MSLTIESDVGVATTSSGSVSLSSNDSGESISWTLSTGEATDGDSGLVFFDLKWLVCVYAANE